jgi:SAM-dependent methyltransferase
MSVQGQDLVNEHFEGVAAYWAEVYERFDDLFSRNYQERLRVVVDFAHKTGLPSGSRALDIGCGAGYATVALAKHGYHVDAVDAVPSTVDSTRNLVAKAGLEHSVKVGMGDIHALPFTNNTFDLVIAVGVLPWLRSTVEPLQEIRRILRPGGYLIVTVENRWGLRQFLNPLANPLLRPVKEATKTILRGLHLVESRPRPRRTSIWGFAALLDAQGFEKLDGVTLGFGPFTFAGWRLLPNRFGIKVHGILQDMAYRGVPFISACGAEYVSFARKGRPD